MTDHGNFGYLDGKPVPLLTITAPNGQQARLCAYGARLVGLDAPDRHGHSRDIVLGHDRLEDYLTYPTYFGAICGRYANRIAGGRFALDGATAQLDLNEGANHLHGGRMGFDKIIWAAESAGPRKVAFTATSAAEDMGYPGSLTMTTVYEWDTDCRFHITMTAKTDAPTVVNIVNHAYFNLAGGSDVLDHEMTVLADHYTPVRADLIPTGEIRPVAGTAFDFRTPVLIRDALARDASMPDGFDHNWCLDAPENTPAVRLFHPGSGRGFTLSTNEPGVQIYTCGMMTKPVPGKNGQTYGRFSGLTLETQKYPDSPNNQAFPSARLNPGQTYAHRMIFSFFTA
jgi:aldose 1-epimerase